MRITRGPRPVLMLAAVGLAAAVGLSACGAGGGDDAASTGLSGGAADAPRAEPALGGGAEPGGADGDTGAEGPGAESKAEEGRGGGAPARFQVDERAIVYTGSITVRVKKTEDVNRVAERAIAAASAGGGFVGADRRSADSGHSQATLTLRVPANRFAEVVNRLAELGTEESRSIDTDDVTEEVVDLDARITTQQASVNRTRTLLARARTIGEIVSVESELAKREAELASLQAKKRRLDDLTALSTITLTLLGPNAPLEENEEDDRGFLAGVKAGWDAFLSSMQVLLTVLGALLPWALALGIPAYLLLRLTRWLTRRRAPAPAAPAD